jgi:hypothetical protein
MPCKLWMDVRKMVVEKRLLWKASASSTRLVSLKRRKQISGHWDLATWVLHVKNQGS